MRKLTKKEQEQINKHIDNIINDNNDSDSFLYAYKKEYIQLKFYNFITNNLKFSKKLEKIIDDLIAFLDYAKYVMSDINDIFLENLEQIDSDGLAEMYFELSNLQLLYVLDEYNINIYEDSDIFKGDYLRDQINLDLEDFGESSFLNDLKQNSIELEDIRDDYYYDIRSECHVDVYDADSLELMLIKEWYVIEHLIEKIELPIRG